MKRLFAAIRFLTILPLPGGGSDTDDIFRGIVPMFPLVGLLIGGIMLALAMLLGWVFTPMVLAVLLVLLMIAISGGLHMDGLADTADGFFSSRPRERVLEIMKDSHIGTMGVLAIVAVVLLKVSMLVTITQLQVLGLEVYKAEQIPFIVFLMPVAGRCALVLGINLLPPARTDGGLGQLFCGRRSSIQIVWAVTVLFASAWFALEWLGLVAALLTLPAVILFSVYCYRKIGGATGDTLGAACELAETTILLGLFVAPYVMQWI